MRIQVRGLPLQEGGSQVGKVVEAFQEVALEKFKWLNETHHPKPLPQEVLAELDRILAAAEREAGA